MVAWRNAYRADVFLQVRSVLARNPARPHHTHRSYVTSGYQLQAPGALLVDSKFINSTGGYICSSCSREKSVSGWGPAYNTKM